MANLRVDKITSTETFETTGSVQFVRVPSSRLTTDLGSGLGDNFTIEFWILASGIASGSNSPGMFQLSDTSGGLKASTESLSLAWSTSNNYSVFYAGSIGTGSITNDPNTNDVWKHYAMVRNNGVLKIYVDGIEKTSVNGTDDFSGYRYLAIGTYYSTSYPWQGHISNFRILNNKALYTKNFKPPMRELEVTPETVLLACQSKTDATLEKTGKTITANGNAVASELTPGILTPVPKAGAGSAITGSVEFDGSGPTAGGYLEVTPDDDLQFLHKCTDSYTVEAWVHKQATTQGTIFDTGGTSSTTIGTVLFGDSGGVLKFRTRKALQGSPDATITTGDVMANDMWHHVALTYDKSTFKLFVNGILVGSTSYSTESSTDSTQSFKIGAYEYSGTTKDGYFNGHISNLRVVKGTALYTDNFIPPTRELKKIPGTVLLCCQDPDNPLTEATGKTITGYGNLQRTDDVELITNGSFAGDFTGWSNGNPTQFTYSTNSVGGDTSGKVMYYAIDNNLRTFTQYVTCVAGQKYILSFDASSDTASAMVIDIDGTNVVTIDDNNNSALIRYNHVFTAGSASVRIRIESQLANRAYFDNFSVKLFDGSNKGSNFTPQVGDDRKVTFEGVTKVNSDAYFYLPTGDTVTRDSRSGRILWAGGQDGGASPGFINLIQYANITTTGNALDFGDMVERATSAASSSSTRAVIFDGLTPALINRIEKVEIASTGNATTFGDATMSVYETASASNNTRGLNGGGYSSGSGVPANTERIEYVTIASLGDAKEFGDLTMGRRAAGALSSPIRACFAAGYQQPDASGTKTDRIDYVTITSAGDAIDFGNLTQSGWGPAAMSNSVRGVYAGRLSPGLESTIDYITIASTGDAVDFGDTTTGSGRGTGSSNKTRGVFILGNAAPSPNIQNTIDYITLATTGNAKDFGDLVSRTHQAGSTSDSHGGLG